MSDNINQTENSINNRPLPIGALWADRVLAALIDIVLALLFMVVLFVLIWICMILLAAISTALASTKTSVGGDLYFLASFGNCGMCCISFIFPPISYFIIGLLNKVYWVSKRGYSIGQGIMRLRVVDADENFISMGKATLRLCCQIGIGFLPVLGPLFDIVYPLFNDPTRQTLHDKAVGTFVIKTDDPPDFFSKRSHLTDFSPYSNQVD